MEALYAFLRYTDDLADGPATQCPPTQMLAAWRSDLHAVLADDSSAALLGKGTATAILPALCDAVRRFQIPREHLNAVIEGVEMDLDGQSYETFDQLRLYCERVASAVGLACIHIWGFPVESAGRREGTERKRAAKRRRPGKQGDKEIRLRIAICPSLFALSPPLSSVFLSRLCRGHKLRHCPAVDKYPPRSEG